MNDRSLLQAALVGYQNHLDQVNQAIADIRKRLGLRSVEPKTKRPRRRQLSAAARKKIADAQKKRWAAFHKQKKT